MNGKTHEVTGEDGVPNDYGYVDEIVSDLASNKVGDMLYFTKGEMFTPAIPNNYEVTVYDGGVMHFYQKAQPNLTLVN